MNHAMMLLAAAQGGYHKAFDLEIWSLVVFGILLAVLFSAVRKPLVLAMRQREKTLLESLRQAEIATEESRQLMARQEQERARIKIEADAYIEKTKADAKLLHQELVNRARQEAERNRLRAEREINLARNKALTDLWRTAAELSSAIAERAIETRLSADDHRRLIDEAIGDLQQLVKGAA